MQLTAQSSNIECCVSFLGTANQVFKQCFVSCLGTGNQIINHCVVYLIALEQRLRSSNVERCVLNCLRTAGLQT